MSKAVEQLWSEPIYHNCPWIPGHVIPEEYRKCYRSLKPINPVWDHANDQRMAAVERAFSEKLERSVKTAWPKVQAYTTHTALNRQLSWPWNYFGSKLKRTFDRLRWKLHLKLLKWKVII